VGGDRAVYRAAPGQNFPQTTSRASPRPRVRGFLPANGQGRLCCLGRLQPHCNRHVNQVFQQPEDGSRATYCVGTSWPVEGSRRSGVGETSLTRCWSARRFTAQATDLRWWPEREETADTPSPGSALRIVQTLRSRALRPAGWKRSSCRLSRSSRHGCSPWLLTVARAGSAASGAPVLVDGAPEPVDLVLRLVEDQTSPLISRRRCAATLSETKVD